jgi:mRNA interferase MazF
MPAVNPGDVWMTDFGMTAKVRPALLLTGNPSPDELDLVTVLLHTTALRGNRWELNIPKPFLRPEAEMRGREMRGRTTITSCRGTTCLEKRAQKVVMALFWPVKTDS